MSRLLGKMAPGCEAAKGLFEYNKKNFDEDRDQRQTMEYQLFEMRIKQTGMWREDIRQIIEFTQTKVEMYMLVSTLLLGFCATAIVKAVVVEGTPTWLACAHTLMLMGAFMFLLISMILGINAYVASQAYMVRILTQYVRLPIPSWKAIEGSRTYGSTFEKQRSMQMFRTPWLTGTQESHSEDPRGTMSGAPPTDRASQGTSARSLDKGEDGADISDQATDPWGLERRGDDIPELHPLVNDQTSKQRHIWLVREAAKYYLTHEAFCRVSMNLGTSYLAMFFSYYCLTYCLVEDGAPQAAFCGMVMFVCLSLVLIGMDMAISSKQMMVLGGMQFVAPILSFITVYSSMPNGYGGAWEYIVCLGLFTHGAWLFTYIHFLHVRETDTGVFFPRGYKTSLLLDTFGRNPHRARPAISDARRKIAGMPDTGSEKEQVLPAMTFVNGPFRPEDLNHEPTDAAEKQAGSWGPDTFFAAGAEEEEKGNILHGTKPGSQVWKVFRFAAVCLGLTWWLACGVSFYEACIHESHFYNIGMSWERKAQYTPIVSVALQTGARSWQAERMQTVWPSSMARPQGLACDPSGQTFATFGRGLGGHKSVLHGRVSEETVAPAAGYSRSKLVFSAAPSCPELHVEGEGQVIQDLALHKCTDLNGCSALVLPKNGKSLVSCRLEGEDMDIMDDMASGLGLFQRQAILKKINKDEQAPNIDEVLKQEPFKKQTKMDDVMAAGFRNNASVPLARAWLDDLNSEEPSSLSMTPCMSAESGPSECPVLGTSAGRVVLMAPGRAGDEGKDAWVPRRVLFEDTTSMEPGAITDFGTSQLGVLHKETGKLRILDAALDTSDTRPLKFPKPPSGNWASVCSGGGAVFALESGENPTVWRMTPK